MLPTNIQNKVYRSNTVSATQVSSMLPRSQRNTPMPNYSSYIPLQLSKRIYKLVAQHTCHVFIAYEGPHRLSRQITHDTFLWGLSALISRMRISKRRIYNFTFCILTSSWSNNSEHITLGSKLKMEHNSTFIGSTKKYTEKNLTFIC